MRQPAHEFEWEALYTGLDSPRMASRWAAESASAVLQEALEWWIADEDAQDETLEAIASAITQAEQAIWARFEADCQRKGQVC